MNATPASVDVLVVGGGPAGATAAIRIAKLGHAVCIVDSGSGFWSRGFSQSLAPTVQPLLRLIAVEDAFHAEFPASTAPATVMWGDNRPIQREFDSGPAYHVERGRFDSLLRDAAERAGATVLQPATVAKIVRTPGEALSWRVKVTSHGAQCDVRAKIVIDASGRKSRIPAARTRSSAPLIAVLGEWPSGSIGAGTFVEAASDRWYWACANSNRRATAAVFFDPRSRLLAGTASLEEAYHWLIKSSRLLGGTYGVPVRVSVCDAASRHAVDPLEENLIRVGESYLALDPLSSQGIPTSMATGLQAAVAANTWLRCPGQNLAANTFYRDRHAELVEQSQINSHRYYGEAANKFETAFWRLRSSLNAAAILPTTRSGKGAFPDPDVRLRLGSGIRIGRIAVVRGDLAEFASAIVPPPPERAVAFLGAVPVGELASRLQPGTRAVDAIRTWSESVGKNEALKALVWMWQTGIVAAISSESVE